MTQTPDADAGSAQPSLPSPDNAAGPAGDFGAIEQLVGVIQQLSMARDLDAVVAVVRHAARALTGADGATFVLREDKHCFYVDEDAISPLWKGHRFPLDTCISGWTMLHRATATVEDIYADPRIPADVYRPTFVKSLVMVPIRTQAPIGAIGNYWASQHRATPEEIRVLQALADSTSIAMENVQLYADLEHRVRERTRELENANQELAAFSYSVSHDLQAPLRRVMGFSQALQTVHGEALDEDARDYLTRIHASAQSMSQIVDALLHLSRLGRAALRRKRFDLSTLVGEVIAELQRDEPARTVDAHVAPHISAFADPKLCRILVENLLRNAWKFTADTQASRIEFGCSSGSDGGDAQRRPVYYVRDNGVGFKADGASDLFQPFRRLHSARDFPGTGIGLATARRIVERHGGRIWAEAEIGKGATFFWTLGEDEAVDS